MAQGESYAHPRTCFFHVVFKAAAIVFYILSSFFNENFVIDFVVTILLVALDFWVVKNVSGRILVGLRWCNEINESGESIWRYECLDPESLARINKKDSWLFWWTLYAAAIIWSALGIVAIVKINIDYLLVDGICLTLTMANIIGFTKCRKDAKRQVQDFASQSFASHVSSTLQSAFTVVWCIRKQWKWCSEIAIRLFIHWLAVSLFSNTIVFSMWMCSGPHLGGQFPSLDVWMTKVSNRMIGFCFVTHSFQSRSRWIKISSFIAICL